MKQIIFIFICLFLVIPSPATSGQAMEDLKFSIDQVIQILKETSQIETNQKKLQKEKIGPIISKIFNFTEMAKRSVARNWKKFSEEQKIEFSQIFGELLINSYIDKMNKGFSGESVIFINQEKVSDKKVLVKTKVIRTSMEIPVDYRMQLHDKTWKIYDVKVEGVSMMKNYRAQYHSILLKKSPSYLIESLKKRIKAAG